MMEKGKSSKQANEAVPIFLRKTYHMIDTCDSNVACWSNDGETFIVKNTDVFEKSIIPQFFKHSKFSSFVRQLNFYGFRKIKYADTIKIDAKLEAETANFWRFRHEKFIRGKPDLLIDIKRSNGHQTAATQKSSPTPMAVVSSSSSLPTEDSGALKNEVTTLKERIEAMTKNIDQLTSMVQKVTLKQEEHEVVPKEDTDTAGEVGAKRKKVDTKTTVTAASVRPDIAVSAMELDSLPSLESVTFPPLPPVAVGSRQSSESDSSKLTDNDFVDQLFNTFGEEDNLDSLLTDAPMADKNVEQDENAPDPRLMNRLSDALKMLPREMQEMIVDRLVANIVGTDSMEKNVKAASALTDAAAIKQQPKGKKGLSPNQVPPSPVLDARPSTGHELMLPMPLAAATLAALLTQYSESVKDKTVLAKEEPLPRAIPMHA